MRRCRALRIDRTVRSISARSLSAEAAERAMGTRAARILCLWSDERARAAATRGSRTAGRPPACRTSWSKRSRCRGVRAAASCACSASRKGRALRSRSAGGRSLSRHSGRSTSFAAAARVARPAPSRPNSSYTAPACRSTVIGCGMRTGVSSSAADGEFAPGASPGKGMRTRPSSAAAHRSPHGGEMPIVSHLTNDPGIRAIFARYPRGSTGDIPASSAIFSCPSRRISA